MMMIADNINKIRQQINEAEQTYHRESGSVHLLAISKLRPIAEIKSAVAAGLNAFGESYLQEAMPKIEALSALDLQWHFIGPIQANKTKLIATNFSWVHSVDRVKIAQRLNEQRPENLPPLNICIQINISREGSKSGVTLSELPAVAMEINAFKHLKLRGLMAIPKKTIDFDAQRSIFRKLNQAMLDLNAKGLELDTLSIGMSSDFIAAIAEGATVIRLGRAIFGSR